MAAPIRFYFDYISPYAYIAWTQMHALAARHGSEVEPIRPEDAARFLALPASANRKA